MVYIKRGSWCYRNEEGKLFKFATEAEANAKAGITANLTEKELDEAFAPEEEWDEEE